MPKINQEEYEVLKELDDKWKWIVRDKGTGLETYDTKPFKNTKGNWWWQSKDSKVSSLISESDKNVSKVNFQFIQHLDSEPYNIAELIKEYEFGKILLAMAKEGATLEVEKESEETEVKKNKEWAFIELGKLFPSHAEMYDHPDDTTVMKCELLNKVYDILSQLDEPETLSEKWIGSNSVYASSDGVTEEYVHVDDLQNLLVPKQELPVIPKFVADWIERTKPMKSLRVAFILIEERKEQDHEDKLAFWIEEGNSETFARAWLDGYTVEEQKYYVSVRDEECGGFWFLSKNNNGDISIGVNRDWSEVDWDRLKLTEQEIKDYDERYWAFRKPVEELEE